MNKENTVTILDGDGSVLAGPVPAGAIHELAARVRDASKGLKDAVDDSFALEPSDGNIPERVIDELCAARTTAKDYAEAYTAAVTGQAEKYKINAAALKRYINARQADKLDDLDAELSDLEKLIG